MRSRSPVVTQLVSAIALASVCGAIVVGSMLVAVGLAAKRASDEFLALPTGLAVSGVPERSVLLDAKGKAFAYFWKQDRSAVPASAMAPSIRQAVVAVEDQRFFLNKGVDLLGAARAVVQDVSGGQHQGGSTITQQYVKNLLILRSPDAATADTLHRKLVEARYALALNRRMSKDDVLTGYLNLVYFGRQAYGVEAAAETFFDTSAAHLTVPQAALLAGMVNSPSAFDPFTHPDAAKQRRNVVLDRMVDAGYLSRASADVAMAAPVRVRQGAPRAGCYGSPYGYSCDYVLRELLSDPQLGSTPARRQLRLDTAGLTIRTTLDPRVQASANRAVAVAGRSRAALAAVIEQPGTGAVLAMTASVPFGVGRGQSSVNLPLGGSSGFQAGSTFKVFVLAQAIADGIPLDLRLNAPAVYTSRKFFTTDLRTGRTVPYTIKNAGDSESGVFTLEQATWHSINTYYLQLEERVGLDGPASIAEHLGVFRADGGPLLRVPSFTLGTNEVKPIAMAGAFAAFAAHGRYCPAYGVAGVTGLRWHRSAEPCRQALDPRVADTVTRVLQGVIAKGTGQNAAVPGDAAGKTGTVENFSAAWFDGYTPAYAAVVWMGDPRGGFAHPLVNVDVAGRVYPVMYGGDLPAQVWSALIRGAPGGSVGSSFVLRPPPPSHHSEPSTPARPTTIPRPSAAPPRHHKHGPGG